MTRLALGLARNIVWVAPQRRDVRAKDVLKAEEEVHAKHGHAERPRHLPPRAGDGDDDEEHLAMRMPSETTMPPVPTQTGQYMMLKSSHGSGRPTATSKMFEPIDDDTAMSPWPCLATMTEESRSGTLVPAARNVRPMITTGILRRAPSAVAHSTMG